MRDREKRCSECLQIQKEEMESPYVCEECEVKVLHEKIRSILIAYGNKEHGDCIIDEICEAVGVLPTTVYNIEELQ